jgi:hypothetical protein
MITMFSRPTVFQTIRVAVPAILATLLFATQLRAQTPTKNAGRAQLDFEKRLNGTIKSMTSGADTENAEFNLRIAAINASAPLDPRHLDSADVAANVARVVDFTTYLKRARHASDSLAQSFDDSMYVLSEERPADVKVLGAAEIEESFKLERASFNTFLDAMNKVYSDVLDVLLFLQHSPYTIVKEKLTFETRTDMKEYQMLTKAVDKDSKALSTANQNLQKANTNANALTRKRQSDGTP